MQSIGERLEEARKRKGISIREAAEATKIRGDYLHKFESNQYDIKLPEIYVRGFLRTYSNYLKLPAEKIINDYQALGISETKPRTINREVYGRMDLSVASAKNDKAAEPEPISSETTPPIDTAHRNPATFVPQGGTGIANIDKGLLLKFGLIGGGAIIVIGISLWLLLRSPSPTPTTANNKPAATNTTSAPVETWVKAQAGEPTLTLIAFGSTKITVTQFDSGTIIYQGTLLSTETREIPRRGKLRITSDLPQNLKVRIGTSEFELKDKTGYLSSAEIAAPAAR